MNPKPIVRRPIALSTLLVLVALSIGTPGPAAALILPAPDFPLVFNGLDQLGLRSRYSAFASAFGDSEGQGDAMNLIPLDWQASISHAGSVAAVDSGHPEISSFAELQGRAQFGKLRAKTHAWVEGGLGTANAVMFQQFMDVLQVDTEGVLHLNWVVSGTADRQFLLPGTFAASSLTAELFVFPYGAEPIPGIAFDFTNYAKSIINGVESYHLASQSYLYPAGSRWWVMGQLSIESTARATSVLRVLPPYKVETAADFGQTVELFISADAATPESSFHAASGYDYRAPAIPEPASGLLLLAGLLMLCWYRQSHVQPAEQPCGVPVPPAAGRGKAYKPSASASE